MASLTPAICSKSPFRPLRNSNLEAAFCSLVPGRHNVAFSITQEESCNRLSYINQPRGRDHPSILKSISAVGSGFETTMKDLEGGTLTFKKVEIAVESQEADKMRLRVDLTGEDTQKAFDVVLTNFARSAPVMPGFRRQKGGKTSKVPKNLLLDILGRNSVMKFVMREIVTSSVANYVKEKNLNVRGDKIKTIQSEDELSESFLPGNEFGFNVELELVNEETETTTDNS